MGFLCLDYRRSDRWMTRRSGDERGGYGVLVDIILGLLLGFVGGWVFGHLGLSSGGGMIGSVIVAFVGAVVLVGITRLIKKA